MALFKRSLSLTADFLETDDALSMYAKEDAQEIRKFIKYLDINESPESEAERILGVDYLALHEKVHGTDLLSWDYMWMSKPKEEWTPEQVKLDEMHKLIQELEARSWKNAWKLIARRGQRWWD